MSWLPPQSANTLHAADAATLKVSASALRSVGDDLYWIEGRPELAGRRVVVCWRPASDPVIISPPGLSVVSRVHEYGGGAMVVADVDGPLVVAVRATDQAIVTFRPGDEHEEVLVAQPDTSFGDLSFGAARGVILAVSESQHEGSITRSVVEVDVASGLLRTLVEGRDFFASPRLNPSGDSVLFLAWDHPSMPWEAAELWTASLIEGELDDEPRRQDRRLLAGGLGAPAAAPRWLDDGSIVAAVERDGWLRPVGVGPDGTLESLVDDDAEYAGPLWELGESEFAQCGREVVAIRRANGVARVVSLGPQGSVRYLATDDQTVSSVVTTTSGVAWMGSTPVSLSVVERVDSSGAPIDRVLLGPDLPSSLSAISQAESVSVVAEDGHEVHGLFFAPTTESGSSPPPVVVFCHGGPTSQARAGFDPAIQALCARGFAVVAANYAGSTGYGAAYRHRLDNRWGIADVEDCAALVEGLGESGLIDPSSAAIRGGSAGGFTALLALTTGRFTVGVSLYGVADLVTLAASTHDFESRYLDSLVGSPDEDLDDYVARSPVTRAAEMTGTVLILQGLDDPVVPPEQAASMVAALRSAGQSVELIEFEGESHGFRRLDTLVTALQAEIDFYEAHLLPGAGGDAK